MPASPSRQSATSRSPQPRSSRPRRPRSHRRLLAASSTLVPRRSSAASRQRQRGVALEMGILISVNLVVIAAASTAIVKLVPYNLAQRAKLGVLHAEVDDLAQRVDGLRQDFSRYFAPQRALATQRELGNLALPGQRPVRFIDPLPAPVTIPAPEAAVTAPPPAEAIAPASR